MSSPNTRRALETSTLWKMCGNSGLNNLLHLGLRYSLKISGDGDTADKEQQPKHHHVIPPPDCCVCQLRRYHGDGSGKRLPGSTCVRFTLCFCWKLQTSDTRPSSDGLGGGGGGGGGRSHLCFLVLEAQKKKTIKAGNDGTLSRGHMGSEACGCSEPSCPAGGAVTSLRPTFQVQEGKRQKRR